MAVPSAGAPRSRFGDTRLAAGQPDETRAVWEEALAILDDLHHPDAGQVRARLAGLGTAPRT